DLTDTAIWDLVARIWEQNTTPEKLREGERLYQANCAACHGETGRGDGVMASALAGDSLTEFGHGTTSPADFGNEVRMLGASPALLQGKILRGGMGTGMPYFGPIFMEDQTWALVDYLWTFQFDRGASVGKAERSAERSQGSRFRSEGAEVGGR
ncbi:MAG: c-type cytochrome, partial [Gemmatimonadales bacterium]|nr:c-type cytochrome [Gemmatimonadales bacterium]